MTLWRMNTRLSFAVEQKTDLRIPVPCLNQRSVSYSGQTSEVKILIT